MDTKCFVVIQCKTQNEYFNTEMDGIFCLMTEFYGMLFHQLYRSPDC